MTIHTIGFTKKAAAEFFGMLRASGARRVVDVRLRNTSGLAGFTKRRDLPWFLRELCGMDYLHLPRLAPTGHLLDAYRNGETRWPQYEEEFLRLMERRLVHVGVPREVVDGSVLLCSEESPERCHRRLVAEHLQRRWRDVEIVHLR